MRPMSAVLFAVTSILSGAVRGTSMVELRMPAVKIAAEDQYTCSAHRVSQEQYILQYEALSDASIAHHILLYGCKTPFAKEGTWACGPICGDEGPKILFAWAKNAPPTRLPPGVGYHVGGATGVNYIVLQVHYIGNAPAGSIGDNSGVALTTSTEKPAFTAGMLLMLSSWGTIPPNLQKVSINVSCTFHGTTPIHLFAFRTHAHTMSTVISGYKRRNGNWEMLAKGNPQWPQAFYPMDVIHDVIPEDHVIAQCTYTSVGMNKTVYMGPSHTDEMCNLYMMYYTNATAGGVPYYECGDNELPLDEASLPAGSDVPPPRNLTLEEHAAGHGHSHHGAASDDEEAQHAAHPSSSGGLSDSDAKRIEIRMPNFRPPTEDYYSCTSYKVLQDEYIVQYMALADATTAHHILLFACDEPYSKDQTWSCAGMPCKGISRVVFAWAQNAPPMHLPPDVGYHIGGTSGVAHLVLQVHYVAPIPADKPADSSGLALYVTEKKPKYSAGIFLLVNNGAVIPADTPKYSAGVSCKFPGRAPIYTFAYRTHAHTWSRVVAGYKQVAPKSWELLGKGNPNWPQAFYPMDRTHVINPGDVVAAQCTYNTVGTHHSIYIGSTHNDEMCNLYMMFYTNDTTTFYACSEDDLGVASQLPAEAREPLPPNPALEAAAHGAGHSHHGSGGGAGDGGEQHEEGATTENVLTYVADWAPAGLSKLGQVSGLSTDANGNLVIFHRGPVVWDSSSFDFNNKYLKVADGPIKEDTIITVSPHGDILQGWGKNLFYMPHGLTIDDDNNAYVTDVALHQVFRFSHHDQEAPSLTLGRRFQPGSDDASFCEPSDIAVKHNGDFYVSDGYCNTRVKLYSKEGLLLKQWGTGGTGEGQFALPHALALSEELQLLCVADRVNARIQCFNLDGQFVSMITDSRFASEIYSVAFNPVLSGILYAVNTKGTESGVTEGFVINVKSRTVLATFAPDKGFGRPHDLAVSQDGTAVFVAEIGPNRVSKFAVQGALPHGVRGKIASEHNHIMLDQGGSTTASLSFSTASQKIPIIVGILLVVPVVVVGLVLLGIKIYNAKFGRDRRGFDMGKMLDSSTAHFNPLLNGHSDDSGDESNEEREHAAEKMPIATRGTP